MTYEEWKVIGGPLFAAFPNTHVTPDTLAVYFADLAEYDGRDVGRACEYLRRHEGPFLPSISRIREQVEIERSARHEYERLPDFTGSDRLTEGELREKLQAGVSAGIQQAPWKRPWSNDPPMMGPAE